MKHLTAMFIISLSCSCATTHDYCVDHLDHYKSYDECYAERSAAKEKARHALSHIGDGAIEGNGQINCISQTYGGNTQTNCR